MQRAEAAHNVGASLIAPGVPRPGCAEFAAQPGPPRSTEFPIPDDATMLLQISAVLQQLCDQNSDLRAKCPTIFDSVAKPTMSVHCYLIRIRRYTKFDSLCFLVALAYLRRLCDQHGPSFCPTHHNIHRLFITAVLVASKANDGAPRDPPFLPSPSPMRVARLSHPRWTFTLADVFHANVFMAQCGGITNAELNKLEVDLCERMLWGLTVEPEELIVMTQQLGDASSPLWSHWGTEVCERRWLRRAQHAAELAQPAGRVSPCGGGSGRVSPPSQEASFNAGRPRHQRSLSLGSMLSHRKPGADGPTPEFIAKERSPEAAASPRSVLSRTLSFGGFLGSFSALVNLGSSES
jgi:hypothetical protein